MLKRFFDFYINSSLHVALAVTSLTAVTCYKFSVEIDHSLLVFIFFSAITGYNFIKYAAIAKLHHRQLTPNLKMIQVFSLIIFCGLIYLAFQQKVGIIKIVAGLGLLTMLYGLPFLPNARNLRSLKSLKIFVIALVWAGTAVLLPLVGKTSLVSTEVLLYFLEIFLMVLVLMFPFEIRDLKFDIAELKTIPQLIGVKKNKILGVFLLIIILGIDYYL